MRFVGNENEFLTSRIEVDNDGVFYRDASVDGQGGTIREKPVFTAQQAADYLNRGDGLVNGMETGAIWAGALDAINNPRNPDYGTAVSHDYAGGALDHLNFGFYNSKADIDPAYAYVGGSSAGTLRLTGFSAFDADQRDAARQAIGAWDELIKIKFVETDSAHADINYMNTTTGPIQASAYLPYDYSAFFNGVAGDVAVNPNQSSNHLFDEGQYGLTTLIHETGHTLGLEHPGSYNFGPNFSATYANGAEYYQDSYQYSIMSYWGGEETGMQQVDWNDLTYRYNSTPGVHDILAVQQMYGADLTTRNGNDVYGFNTNLSTHGLNDDSYDFVKTPTPVIAIWDGGGNDTLDLSGYKTPSIINLNPGSMSSAGGTEQFLTLAEINANRAAEGLAPRSQATLDLYNQLFKDAYHLTDGLMHDNIAIAYNAIIENAIGGSGNDVITGNAVDNFLSGGAGDDRISAGDGIDVIKLGVGHDVFVAEQGTRTSTKAGAISYDIVTDFTKGDDKIDVSEFGSQVFRGTSSSKNAGDLTYKTFGNVNAAENALGIDIHSHSGVDNLGGPVTVVFVDTDHKGGADEAIVLLNHSGVSSSDFIFGF